MDPGAECESQGYRGAIHLGDKTFNALEGSERLRLTGVAASFWFSSLEEFLVTSDLFVSQQCIDNGRTGRS